MLDVCINTLYLALYTPFIWYVISLNIRLVSDLVWGGGGGGGGGGIFRRSRFILSLYEKGMLSHLEFVSLWRQWWRQNHPSCIQGNASNRTGVDDGRIGIVSPN